MLAELAQQRRIVSVKLPPFTSPKEGIMAANINLITIASVSALITKASGSALISSKPSQKSSKLPTKSADKEGFNKQRDTLPSYSTTSNTSKSLDKKKSNEALIGWMPTQQKISLEESNAPVPNWASNWAIRLCSAAHLLCLAPECTNFATHQGHCLGHGALGESRGVEVTNRAS